MDFVYYAKKWIPVTAFNTDDTTVS